MKKVYFDKVRHANFLVSLNIEPLLDEVRKEFIQQKVIREFSFEDIVKISLLDEFHKYHRNIHQKQYPDFIYEKYLEACGVSPENFDPLQLKIDTFINRKWSFYEQNDSFFKRYGVTHSNKNNVPTPRLIEYKYFDFVKIKGNKISCNVPENNFSYYLNNTQIQIIEDVTIFVKAALKLVKEHNNKNVDYISIRNQISMYIEKNEYKREYGLSYNLETITFDYHKILLM